MRPFFARAIFACRPAIFASPNRSFGYFRHDSSFGSLALALNLGRMRAIPIALLVVRDHDHSAQIPYTHMGRGSGSRYRHYGQHGVCHGDCVPGFSPVRTRRSCPGLATTDRLRGFTDLSIEENHIHTGSL